MTKKEDHNIARQSRSGDSCRDRSDSLDSMEGLSAEREFVDGHSIMHTSLGALFADMYHELSNPLANIRLAAEVLLEDLEDSQDEGSPDMEYVKYKLSGIVREVDRTGSLLRELSQISRAGDLHMEWVNLGELLKRASAFIKLRIPPRVRVTVQSKSDILVRCDEQMLMTAFMNLICDAVDAVGDEGNVDLEAHMDSEETVEISVSNTGDLLLEQGFDNIFEPFFSTRKAGRGKGLGLFVPFQIIKSHNGIIWTEPVTDRGTAIKLRLPAKHIE